MKATETNLNRFLAQNDTQFLIPVYQRNYDWTLAHCKQLIDDILFVGCEKNITSHFIGSVVFIHDDVYSSTGVRELTIIDGQQRITTVTLIYILLYKIALRNKKQQLVSRIHETYLINLKNSSRFYLGVKREKFEKRQVFHKKYKFRLIPRGLCPGVIY